MKHRGIRLGAGQIFGTGPVRYRVRHGRELCFCTVEGLDREWLDVYVRWLRARGRPDQAMQLKSEWVSIRGAR